jgi:predicted ribosome quality control (RQC) complex YloA/Tae2 family protein
MKTELNFLELHFLVQELQDVVGARVDKIYEPDSFLLQIHKSGAGKLFVRITNNVIWIAKEKPAAPEKFSGLCSAMRRFLEGKKIAKIEQLGSERIVQVTFETQKETFYLFIELFQNGNIILTDAARKILGAKEERAWKDREIKRGLNYILPPAKKNLFELKASDISGDEKSLASLGFGKMLAREIIARGSDFKAYQSFLNEKLSPRAYPDGELSPVKLVQYADEGHPFKTFSELIDSKLPHTLLAQKVSGAQKAFAAKKAKLEDVIGMQSKNIAAMEKEAIEVQRKGELIYEHYQELKDILEELNKAKEKFSLQEMKSKLKGHAKIKDLNPKTSDVIIEI